ncbi:eukaryotic porin/Tom40 [Massariosphaeria phaeospora]|uniref:Eukaryotic porin/Tom40 n=1 Tax=Massariosphaeria phaeospora TaxID=100035 RepID=A0A7C8M537_9PLEO|nr:eukaryotic porin/Tom40 [Massariosphaeria phaeospora]
MELDQKHEVVSEVIGHNGPFGRLSDVYRSFHERREALGLSNPGTVENIAKEVQRDVFLNNLSFSGLRAELTKAFSVAPLFQVSHSLAMGSQMQPPYSYGALYGSSKVFLQGNLDNDLQFSGRFNWRWTQAFVTKTSVQLTSQGNMLSLENDYTGSDFSASLKAVNPSVLDGGITGMVMGSYLQAVTPRLSLGIDAFWTRPAMAYAPELNVSYAARYKAANWMACGQIVPDRGVLEASYWRRLSEKVETGINCNLAFAGIGPGGPMGAMQKEGSVTIGAKYDFRTSSFRAQIDNQGKVSCLLEKVIAPPIRVTFSGEIDHKQNAAKLGLAVSIEAADSEVMEQQEQAPADAGAIPF